MSLSGRVIQVGDPWILVEVAPNPHCQGCHACSGLLADGQKDQPKVVKALRGTLSVTEGDRVTLDSRPGEGSLIAIVVFGFPMGAFFLGLYLGPPTAAAFGVAPQDWQALVGGMLGLGLAGGVLALGGHRGWYDRLAFKVSAVTPALTHSSGCGTQKRG